mmetsp:Transcript_14156/g.38899  ORF Transcript_14156/g.38899 Transcript_14156/m.38899 type:complete len:239 (+) Transcript_14156:554-1270(+)
MEGATPAAPAMASADAAALLRPLHFCGRSRPDDRLALRFALVADCGAELRGGCVSDDYGAEPRGGSVSDGGTPLRFAIVALYCVQHNGVSTSNDALPLRLAFVEHFCVRPWCDCIPDTGLQMQLTLARHFKVLRFAIRSVDGVFRELVLLRNRQGYSTAMPLLPLPSALPRQARRRRRRHELRTLEAPPHGRQCKQDDGQSQNNEGDNALDDGVQRHQMPADPRQESDPRESASHGCT